MFHYPFRSFILRLQGLKIFQCVVFQIILTVVLTAVNSARRGSVTRLLWEAGKSNTVAVVNIGLTSHIVIFPYLAAVALKISESLLNAAIKPKDCHIKMPKHCPYNNEGQLLDKLKNGSEIAMEQIFEKHYKVLFFTAYDILNNVEDAKDVVQDLFAALWSKRAHLKIQGSLEKYLSTAIRNRCFDKLDTRKVYKKNTAEYGFLHAEISEDLTLIDQKEIHYQQLSEVLREFVSHPAYKSFQLMHLQGQHHMSVAQQLNLPPATVRKQASRLFHKIRAALLQK